MYPLFIPPFAKKEGRKEAKEAKKVTATPPVRPYDLNANNEMRAERQTQHAR